MAKAQFRNETAGIDVSKTLPTPKVQTLEAWFKLLRKTIPQIPDPKTTDWKIEHQGTTGVQWINFTMVNSCLERCYITVDRKASQFARV